VKKATVSVRQEKSELIMKGREEGEQRGVSAVELDDGKHPDAARLGVVRPEGVGVVSNDFWEQQLHGRIPSSLNFHRNTRIRG